MHFSDITMPKSGISFDTVQVGSFKLCMNIAPPPIFFFLTFYFHGSFGDHD